MPEVKRPILFCGENPIATLYDAEGKRAAVVSYWRCTYSQHGAGNVLIVWSGVKAYPISGIYTDNMPLAAMLLITLTQHFPEFRNIPVMTLPRVKARCQLRSDGRERYLVECAIPKGELRIEWADLLDHKQIIWPQFPAGAQRFDLTTVICPCREATITLNGQRLPGTIKLSESDGQPSSSAFLALAETWAGPL